MDVAYDHIQEETLSPEQAPAQGNQETREGENAPTFNAEIQEAYKAFSASPWGAKLGGFLGSVRKQGETFYEEAKQEYTSASEQATKGFTDLRASIVGRTRGLSLNQPLYPSGDASSAAKENLPVSDLPDATNVGSSEALQESESMLARFRVEAAKRLKEIERAEDAADEALLRFGTNIRNFLRDAVTIAPPADDAPRNSDGTSQVLFESKDAEGRRVIHTNRFDAQLHVIHSSLDSFLRDPASKEYEPFRVSFDVEKRTDDIAKDLERFEELRRAMEKLVPERVEYAVFWARYYFLRHVIETEESRRRELLKGATSGADEEEINWDEDSESESTTPNPAKGSESEKKLPSAASSSTLKAQPAPDAANDMLKPAEARRSGDQQSQADSDASYDLVSGATSRTPGSPKEDKKKEAVAEESDEEDWE